MNTTVSNATEYRDLPLALLTESTTNPRRIFEDEPLKELAESIRSQGILSPLLVRPLNEHGFEIVAGARRYRAAQMLIGSGAGHHCRKGEDKRIVPEGAFQASESSCEVPIFEARSLGWNHLVFRFCSLSGILNPAC
jgi:hypothetical protein